MHDSFGAVLRRTRLERKLSLRALGVRAHYSSTHLCDIEKGAKAPTVDLGRSLDEVFGTGSLFAGMAGNEPSACARFAARSHKFLPAFIGAAAVARLSASLAAEPGQWHPGARCQRIGDVTAEVWTWPWGVAIVHLVEEQSWPDLATMAAWRYSSYPDSIAWASQHLTELVGERANVDYALSAYWLTEPGWSGAQLATAMQVLSSPRIVTGDQGQAIEHRLLCEGWANPGLRPIGVADASIGYASWSGVSYHPIDAARALTEDELVSCELAVQSVWQYAAWIAAQVEMGLPLDVPAEFGWRFLRGAQSRLSVPRPQETVEHRAMRDAILATCDLGVMLERAVQALKEAA